MIDLPKKTEDGRPKISYSQYTAFKDKTFFNKIQDINSGKMKTLSGAHGYVLKYFLGYEFPPSEMDIYGQWGSRCEDAICKRIYTGFTSDEIKILKTVEPLGLFQKEILIDFDEFVLQGFIDDTKDESLEILRDYKGCSMTTVKKYQGAEYKQLQTYSLLNYRKSGILPKRLEVVPIIREGSHIKPPILVSAIHPTIEIKTSHDELRMLEAQIRTTVKEISELYSVFKQVNEIK